MRDLTPHFFPHVGLAPTPAWLDTDGLHGYLLGRSVKGHADRDRACRQYTLLAAKALDADATFWQQALRGQVFLGDDAFVQRMQALAPAPGLAAREVPKAQRLRAENWEQYLQQSGGQRNHALHAAYREGGMTMTALARETGLSVAHVGRLIAAAEQLLGSGRDVK